MFQSENSYYAWACDFESHTGEGKLAREFIYYFAKKKDIKEIFIETPSCNYYLKNKIIIKKSIKNSSYERKYLFSAKYISPFVGIFKIYFNFYLKKKKIIYLNYLPIWNLALFFFLPKKIVLGPITGSSNRKKINNNEFFDSTIRKYVFPLFIYFSKKILENKFDNIIFSTLLVDYNKSKNKKNFQLVYYINKSKKIKINIANHQKKIDILFYYRNHPTKNSNKYFIFLKKVKDAGFVVKICGDLIKNFNFDNYGFLMGEQMNKILKETRFVLATSENPISFYIQDALLHGSSILFDLDNKEIVNKYYSNCIFVNFEKEISKSNIVFLLRKKQSAVRLKEKLLSSTNKIFSST